ncbi:MAG: pyridoxal phosphate-dependent aminotransferase [Bacteroidales bacterium]|nr:pyridoxal phosphate-dependent aminotransferase [Bacteroidales bacterium]MCK9498002.1 pyridoxal phosphate-dependent aminotransferase [Bacteroidales bacterium]MDY0315310.1 pyridoxal phosphate-dependent aminotransferase [Bacteroidales bacterium]NLB86656.1 pyridoxal phosphate-dependent aminotransferase [Bacteroidales bacterium]
MEKISDRLNKMPVSATLAMAQKSRDLQAQGVDVINLSIGEPDFDTPQHIKDAAKKAIDDNFTHYPPVPGYDSLRKAIVEKFKRENNLEFKTEQIVVSTGAKHSIINVFLAILNPGDEVIVPAPYWVSYPAMVGLAEAEPVYVKCTIDSDFKMTAAQLEAAITPKTRALIFSSPSNPTGNLYSREELKSLAKVIEKHPNIIVVSDEIYEHINFVGKHESIAQFPEIKDRVVVVNGVSKGYAMTGWRIGFIGAPAWIAKAVTKLQGQFTSGACTIAQKASEAALNAGVEEVHKMTAIFKKRKDAVLEFMKDIPGLKTNIPEGAFYVFPEVSYFFGKKYEDTIINTSNDLALYLLDKAHVATVAGDAFGSPECLRLSYATSEELMLEALKRIKKALSELK